MKTLQSSSKGQRSTAARRGRGGGHRDTRFAARFTDPRFQLAQRVARSRAGLERQRSARDRIVEAARHDERFSKLVDLNDDQPRIVAETESVGEDDDVVDDDSCEEEELMERVLAEGEGPANADELIAADRMDEETVAWEAQELSYTEPHYRLAVVNCDWDHIRAVDIYAILFHALPLGGELREVCIYLSDYGRKMLEHERVHGPDLWTQEPEKADAMSSVPAKGSRSEATTGCKDKSAADRESSEDDGGGWDGQEETDTAATSNLTEDGEDGEFFSAGKYRAYEMNRMKYYYAVASFDSAETAAAVYAALDGIDIEASGVVLDLRYVEDDEHFDNPVSRADRIPANFRPLAAFKAAALTQTRFRISWDQDDAFRHLSIQDSFTGTTAEDDLGAYLAPPDSDDEDEAMGQTGSTRVKGGGGAGGDVTARAKIRRRYAALLEEIGGLPEQDAEEEESSPGPGAEADVQGDTRDADTSSDDDDDDSLNRFSDVEFSAEEASAEHQTTRSDEDEGELGELEATLDVEAGAKAVELQREARLRHKTKEGTLADRAELRYKLRRKEMKKSKKEMLREERAAMQTASAMHADNERAKLVAALASGGADVADEARTARKLKGKERRKAHARGVKERLAKERAEMKQKRALARLGVVAANGVVAGKAEHAEAEATAALTAIDPRFQDKLLSDARFHINVAQRDRRIDEQVVRLASAVVKARRGARRAGGSTSAQGEELDASVDYFLHKNKPVS